MRSVLIVLGLICGLFVLMGANCNVTIAPAGTYGPSVGVLPAGGLFGQGLSYPAADDGNAIFGTGVPLVGSKMGFWTVY